jgi:predicted DCC family thiol-disulfide oxidoreductase YuxK
MDKLTVYFDGSCPLCRAEIDHYRRCRGADGIAFVDVSAGTAAPDLSCAVALARFHVRDGEGRLHSGAAAFARLWRALPGWRWLGRVVGTPVLLPVAELAYRGFLPVRPHLSRLFARMRGRR